VDSKGQKFRHEDDWTQSKRAGNDPVGRWWGSTVFFKRGASKKIPPSQIKDPESLFTFSQAGFLVFAFDTSLVERERDADISILSWKSFRLKRKAASTLAAETQALSISISSVQWHRLLFLECFKSAEVDQDWERTVSPFPAVAIVDSKSVYDAVHKLANTASQVEDKRTAIDLAIIKRDMEHSNLQIRWVPTEAQMADSFTKKMSADSLRGLLKSSRLSIVSEERALQSKAESRLEKAKANFGEERVLSV
jgi:hypothetical protein